MVTQPSLNFELALWQAGMLAVAGVDEAGRGAWAGPVASAAVILPPDPCILEQLEGVRDSKQMTPLQRAYWAGEIRRTALAWGTGFASHQEIDSAGLLPATRLSMMRALANLSLPPEFLLIDAVRLPAGIPQSALVKGDARSLSIAAASVLAKTARDAFMVAQDDLYPGYEFWRHKGYGTRRHQLALLEHGPSDIHRRSFHPVHNLIAFGVLWPAEDEEAGDTLDH